MAANTFRCRLVTPAESLIDEPVVYANVPAWDGLMGIQHGRAPIVARLGLGELTLRFPEGTHGGGDRKYLIDGGFAQMAGNELIILAENAVPAETIAESDAQAELTAAEKATVPADAGDRAAEAERLRHRRERARMQLRIARHNKGRGI
ncbi:MAG: F0F1 ATP synthase subunit epsilon [Planctomycetota bacterium]